MLRSLTIIIMLALISAPAVPAAVYHPGYSSSYALVVGINTYQHWPNLEYAAQDAAQMAAVLKQMDFHVFILTNHNATKKNILRRLEQIRQAADANARVVFYFAGHGQTEDLPGGRERGYIVPVDADAYDWQGTMLPMDRLNRTIKNFKAKHILLAFDSCYSGLGLTRSIKRQPKQGSAYIHKMMQTRSIQIITAGSRSEQAIEAQGHGLFTNHLLAALNGAADINSDGHITATEIYATVRPSITQESNSRQTPQFGYIEGNGDIVFARAPVSKAPAFILIHSSVQGIDVWAGSSKIGHGLTAGRHRLTALAGPTTIIIKKGGQSLYREQVNLRANHTFAIRIGATLPAPLQREPFARRTITHPQVDDYSNSIAYDLDGDSREEIVTAAGSSLYAFNADGSALWQRTFGFQVSLDLIDRWRSRPVIGLSGVDDSKVHLLLLDSGGQEVWHHVRTLRRDGRGKTDGDGRIAKLADIDLDGRKEVIALTTAQRALQSRGVIVYDQHGRELWHYLIGPKPQNVVVWKNRHGRCDLIIGTYASADGNRESHNGTHDRQSYLISVDSHGRTNWVKPMGEHHTGVRVFLVDSNHHGQRTLYAHKFSSPQYREDSGGLYRISESGGIGSRFDTDNAILSVAASAPASNRVVLLYAADNKMNVYQLDENLNLLQKKSLQAASPSRQFRLVGVHDYDGDGDNEVLVYSYDCLLSDKNPLAAKGPRSKVFYSNMIFEIYAHDFSELIKSVSLAQGWQKQNGFTVTDLNRPEAPHYPFMALGDKIIVYNF